MNFRIKSLQGEILRKSATRPYTHGVFATLEDGTTGNLSLHTRRDLAVKKADEYARYRNTGWTQLQVQEVQAEEIGAGRSKSSTYIRQGGVYLKDGENILGGVHLGYVKKNQDGTWSYSLPVFTEAGSIAGYQGNLSSRKLAIQELQKKMAGGELTQEDARALVTEGKRRLDMVSRDSRRSVEEVATTAEWLEKAQELLATFEETTTEETTEEAPSSTEKAPEAPAQETTPGEVRVDLTAQERALVENLVDVGDNPYRIGVELLLPTNFDPAQLVFQDRGQVEDLLEAVESSFEWDMDCPQEKRAAKRIQKKLQDARLQAPEPSELLANIRDALDAHRPQDLLDRLEKEGPTQDLLDLLDGDRDPLEETGRALDQKAAEKLVEKAGAPPVIERTTRDWNSIQADALHLARHGAIRRGMHGLTVEETTVRLYTAPEDLTKTMDVAYFEGHARLRGTHSALVHEPGTMPEVCFLALAVRFWVAWVGNRSELPDLENALDNLQAHGTLPEETWTALACGRPHLTRRSLERADLALEDRVEDQDQECPACQGKGALVLLRGFWFPAPEGADPILMEDCSRCEASGWSPLKMALDLVDRLTQDSREEDRDLLKEAREFFARNRSGSGL